MKSILSSERLRTSSLSSGLRYELKLASETASPTLARSWIRLHPEGFRVAYAARVINNLYFDTADLQSFNDNLSGVNERRKLRLRWYGALEISKINNPVLELKIKENMLGEKKSHKLDLPLDITRPYKELLETLRAQVSGKWRSRLLTFTQPTLINRYRREYYVSADGAIRCTLDYDLVSYDQRLGSRPNLNRRLPRPASVLIEVKSGPEYQERLQRVMGYFPIARSRSSKYVNGVMGGIF